MATQPDAAASAAGSALFALPPALGDKLMARAQFRRTKADHVLFAEGDACDGCYVIEEGLMKVTVGGGKHQRILALLERGAIVGELSVIDGSPRSATVTAVKDTRLRFISRHVFQSVAEEHPELYRYVASFLSKRLRDTNTIVESTTFLSLKGRIARSLLNLGEAFGKDVGGGRIVIQQKVTHGDIAAIAGIARESVSRIMAAWTEAAVVSRTSGYYCLENRAALEDEAKS